MKIHVLEGAGEPGSTVGTGSLNSAPQDHADTESGELLDYNDASVLEQFHEDALAQVSEQQCVYNLLHMIVVMVYVWDTHTHRRL